jgi:hypothetical protein
MAKQSAAAGASGGNGGKDAKAVAPAAQKNAAQRPNGGASKPPQQSVRNFERQQPAGQNFKGQKSSGRKTNGQPEKSSGVPRVPFGRGPKGKEGRK